MKTHYFLWIFISLIIIVFIILGIFVGVTAFIGKAVLSPVEMEVGDVFADNRDGYSVKLNDNFFAKIDLHYDEIDICKTSSSSFDVNEDCTVYYTGIINKLYCSNDYLTAYLPNDNNYIVIDCDNKNNIKTYKSFSETDFDLSMFTMIEL